MIDTAALDDLLDVLKLALKATPVDADLVERLMADLRDFNGMDTIGLLTGDVYQVARKRLAQGYTLREVAWMTGLARSTVGNIRAGRRKARKRAIPTRAAHLQQAAGA